MTTRQQQHRQAFFKQCFDRFAQCKSLAGVRPEAMAQEWQGSGGGSRVRGEVVEAIQKQRTRGPLGKRSPREGTYVSRFFRSAAWLGLSGSESSKGQQQLGVFINAGFILSVANKCWAPFCRVCKAAGSKWLKICFLNKFKTIGCVKM